MNDWIPKIIILCNYWRPSTFQSKREQYHPHYCVFFSCAYLTLPQIEASPKLSLASQGMQRELYRIAFKTWPGLLLNRSNFSYSTLELICNNHMKEYLWLYRFCDWNCTTLCFLLLQNQQPKLHLKSESGSFNFLVEQVFFKENVRYSVWTCRDPIPLILRIQFSLILRNRW